jgi:hypothetical protein
MPEFEVPQFYETAIAMRERGEESDREFRFLCAPVSAIHEDNRYLLNDPRALLSDVLELGEPKELSVAQLPDAIFTLLRLERPGDEAGRDATSVLDLVSRPEWLAGQRDADPEAAIFAEYLAFAEVIPFEASVPKGHALVSLSMKSIGKATQALGAAAAVAPILGPFAHVAYVTGAGLAGAVCVVDGVGLIVGVATSPETGKVLLAARQGIRRLIHRPHPPGGPGPAGTAPPRPETPEQAEERAKRAREKQRDREIVNRLADQWIREHGGVPLGGVAI